MKIYRISLVVLLFAALVGSMAILPAKAQPSAYNAPGLTDLAACWDLEEESGTRYDYTDNNNDLTDNNTVLYGSGISGNAADFETDNTESLTKTDSASLSIGDIEVTMATWVKLETKNVDRFFIYKWNTSANREYRLFYQLSTDTFVWVISADGTNTRAVTASNFGSPSVDTWYFIVTQYNPANDTMYISVNNGSQNSNGYTSGGIYDGNSLFYLAHTSFDGMVDTTLIYKRLLTSDEITWLYNSGSGRSCSALIPTPTPTATNTYTPTITYTPTETYTPTITDTPTATNTYTPSKTFTATTTYTPTETYTPTITGTPTITDTPTITNTPQYDVTIAYETAYPYYVTIAENNAPLVAVMSALCGIVVIAGIIILAVFLIKRNKNK